MKLTTVIGTVIAAVSLAACGSTAVVPPTARPSLALTVAPPVAPTVAPTPTATSAPTPTVTPIPMPSPSESSSPSPSASPNFQPCGGDPAYCGSGFSVATTCAVTGTAQGGSIIITWTAGFSPTGPVLPASVTIDGNLYPVTDNPQTFGPFVVGSYTLVIGSGDNANIWPGPVVISACAVVTATCSDADNPDGVATFSGVTVGDYLNVGESTYSTLITSNPFAMTGMPAAPGLPWVETNAYTTVASGTFNVATCAAPNAYQ